MPRVTKGVFSSTNSPLFTEEDISVLSYCLKGGLTPERLRQVKELRRTYYNFVSLHAQMPNLLKVDALRLEWVGLTRSIGEVVLSTKRGAKHERADQALRQLLAPEYGAAVREFVDAARRLSSIVEQELQDKANIRDTRSGRAVGLRAALWLLHQPANGRTRRGSSLGLRMGRGAGRGARDLHIFLTVIAGRRISGDDIMNAYNYLKNKGILPKLGNSASQPNTAITEFPDIW